MSGRGRRPGRTVIGGAILAASLLLAGQAEAAGLDGRAIGWPATLPFAGILLSIAILPQLVPRFWERYLGLLALGWAASALLPLAILQGAAGTMDALGHALLAEYVPFVILLFALYTIAGGILVGGNLRGTPALNTGVLALGTALASLIGTTGAAMVLIRPLVRANDDRPRNAHVVVFFIFLVANIGGSLTPLGDPPLFLGFLRGVPFFWTSTALLPETLLCTATLLLVFYGLDRHLRAREAATLGRRADPTPDSSPYLRGRRNLLLLGLAVVLVAATGVWRSDVAFRLGTTTLHLPGLVRDGGLLALAFTSLAVTRRGVRAANYFSWHPMAEVAQLFGAIFVCLIPVAAALAAGRAGVFAPLLSLVVRADGTPSPAAFFWLTGGLSSVLDNAPTYLVFFELAGGDPGRLTAAGDGVLRAISAGAVFMGGLTYLGNAPNLMVSAIARDQGVRMPGFGAYMLWSGCTLLPLFLLCTALFYR